MSEFSRICLTLRGQHIWLFCLLYRYRSFNICCFLSNSGWLTKCSWPWCPWSQVPVHLVSQLESGQLQGKACLWDRDIRLALSDSKTGCPRKIVNPGHRRTLAGGLRGANSQKQKHKIVTARHPQLHNASHPYEVALYSSWNKCLALPFSPEHVVSCFFSRLSVQVAACSGDKRRASMPDCLPWRYSTTTAGTADTRLAAGRACIEGFTFAIHDCEN